MHFPFQNSYSALPDSFFARVAPTPVTAPRLIKLNRPLAIQLGLDPSLAHALDALPRVGDHGRRLGHRARREGAATELPRQSAENQGPTGDAPEIGCS